MKMNTRQELIWKFSEFIEKVLEEREYMRDVDTDDNEKSDILIEAEKFIARECHDDIFDTDDEKIDFTCHLFQCAIDTFREVAEYIGKVVKGYVVLYYYKKELKFETTEELERYFNLDEEGRKQTFYIDRDFNDFDTRVC